jgi:hypothetical protein
MSVMTDVDAFIEHTKGSIIIAEGDRFTNGKFIDKAKPIIIKITDDGAVGRLHRDSKQSDRHLKSIQTRVNNIKADHEVICSFDALCLIQQLTDEYNLIYKK